MTALAGHGDEVWIGTDSGLARWHDGQRTGLYGDATACPEAVSAVALDTKGRLWVGTAGQGLAVLGRESNHNWPARRWCWCTAGAGRTRPPGR